MNRKHPSLFRRKLRRKSKNTTPFESNEQFRLCQWMDEQGIIYFAVPNDGDRTPAMAAKAAATGLKRGVPDLCIPMPKSPHHGLWIELKRVKGGVVSEWQKWWIDTLRSQGYRAEVCKGCDAAIEVLKDYFKLC